MAAVLQLGARRVQGIYISMFDEYGEGNQIVKTAESANGVPSGSVLWALDEDGAPCSAGYYLRLTDDGGSMLKGQIALTATRPTQPMIVGASTDMVFSLRAMANNMIVTADNADASPPYWMIQIARQVHPGGLGVTEHDPCGGPEIRFG